MLLDLIYSVEGVMILFGCIFSLLFVCECDVVHGPFRLVRSARLEKRNHRWATVRPVTVRPTHPRCSSRLLVDVLFRMGMWSSHGSCGCSPIAAASSLSASGSAMMRWAFARIDASIAEASVRERP